MPCELKNPARLLLYPDFKFVPRMFGRKDVFLFVDTRMRVNLRCCNGTVTQHLLNIAYVNIFFKQSTLELVLNMLAEATTTEISKEKNPQSFSENRSVAK